MKCDRGSKSVGSLLLSEKRIRTAATKPQIFFTVRTKILQKFLNNRQVVVVVVCSRRKKAPKEQQKQD